MDSGSVFDCVMDRGQHFFAETTKSLSKRVLPWKKHDVEWEARIVNIFQVK